MIEVQIRRLCSRPKPVPSLYGPLECPECRTIGGREDWIDHRPITEWVPFEKASQMAHMEAALETIAK